MEPGLKSVVRRVVPREVRNWARSPKKAFHWIWMNTRFTLGFSEQLEIAQGHTLRFHPLAYESARKAQVDDPEQSEEFHQFVSLCRPGMLLFDIGASFGVFSLICGQVGGRAVAIDPSHIAARMISAQLKLNKLADRVEVLEAAVGDAEGSIEMLSAGIYSDGYLRFEAGRDSSELTRVPVTTVDLLTGRFGEPSHLKIDVEGYEAAVIRGARRLLQQSSPMVFLELHNEMVRDARGDVGFCVRELLDLGYKIYSIHGAPLGAEEAVAPPICRILAKRP
jgi:FkbM family methyltransferase